MRTLYGIALFSFLAFFAIQAKADPLGDWDAVYKVFSHPRCSNCHTPDEHPRWFDEKAGLAKLHGMNVKRGSDESGFGNPGLRCTTCHTGANGTRIGSPPGAPNWHLAPKEMVWFERSSQQICAQIKDPTRNGGRTLAEVADHILHDPLVLWGWAPGAGREPAPGSAQETFDALQRWSAAGAPCP
ncbi:MAG: hypothetical protein ACRCU5_00250 [Rhizobiaceae bacterium]